MGLIVFEMLTGRRAFIDADPHRLLRKQIEEPPPWPREFVSELPSHAERAILRALSKDPEDRFASCQEFARELGSGFAEQSRRHIVPTPLENRISFCIAHVAEESLLARQIGDQLEHKRYACWFYGRDAIPGVPFSSQSRAAIERSQAVVLLVSRPAMRSSDFEREIEHAHKVGCPILPLLIDISREEFEKLAPSWCCMLGPSPMIEYRRTDPLREILDRLVASAETLGIRLGPVIHVTPGESARQCAGQIWATDANQIDILDLDRVLFRNDAIDEFLNSKHRHFISASKGFGKTLLLTCKRKLLTQSSLPDGAGCGFSLSMRPTVVTPRWRPAWARIWAIFTFPSIGQRDFSRWTTYRTKSAYLFAGSGSWTKASVPCSAVSGR
jgi:hypothetical protein